MVLRCVGCQVIDLGDTLDFTPLPGATADALTCDMAGVPTDSSNLVIKVRGRAVQAGREEGGWRREEEGCNEEQGFGEKRREYRETEGVQGHGKMSWE
jgi:hypothetical protein